MADNVSKPFQRQQWYTKSKTMGIPFSKDSKPIDRDQQGDGKDNLKSDISGDSPAETQPPKKETELPTVSSTNKTKKKNTWKKRADLQPPTSDNKPIDLDQKGDGKDNLKSDKSGDSPAKTRSPKKETELPTDSTDNKPIEHKVVKENLETDNVKSTTGNNGESKEKTTGTKPADLQPSTFPNDKISQAKWEKQREKNRKRYLKKKAMAREAHNSTDAVKKEQTSDVSGQSTKRIDLNQKGDATDNLKFDKSGDSPAKAQSPKETEFPAISSHNRNKKKPNWTKRADFQPATSDNKPIDRDQKGDAKDNLKSDISEDSPAETQPPKKETEFPTVSSENKTKKKTTWTKRPDLQPTTSWTDKKDEAKPSPPKYTTYINGKAFHSLIKLVPVENLKKSPVEKDSVLVPPEGEKDVTPLQVEKKDSTEVSTEELKDFVPVPPEEEKDVAPLQVEEKDSVAVSTEGSKVSSVPVPPEEEKSVSPIENVSKLQEEKKDSFFATITT